jgi:hypothetical protein
MTRVVKVVIGNKCLDNMKVMVDLLGTKDYLCHKCLKIVDMNIKNYLLGTSVFVLFSI